jgi:glycosyltransferase involved in cell wall biosynthesis
MKIGIHREPGQSVLGGAEYSMVVLAEPLSRQHEVELVHHFPWLTKDQLVRSFECDVTRVDLRFVPPRRLPQSGSPNPWRRYREARAWWAELSQPYDLFVTFTHGEEPPPFCHAPTGVLVVLFPFSKRPALWPPREGTRGWIDLKERLGRHYLDWEWRRRLASYAVPTCNSEYTRQWTRRWWGLDCQVFYPPVDVDFPPAAKENAVLSVSRFTSMKKQAEMAAAFAQMEDLHREGWKYYCAGGVGDREDERKILMRVQKLGEDRPIHALANLGRAELTTLYQKGKIFWHAAGYGHNEQDDPGLMEHFGIVTVEAMAAGCVPVVIRRGGQPEIVQHGVNGFLWDTVDELQQFTRTLARDEAFRYKMAQAARTRARDFSAERYVQRFRELVTPHRPDL